MMDLLCFSLFIGKEASFFLGKVYIVLVIVRNIFHYIGRHVLRIHNRISLFLRESDINVLKGLYPFSIRYMFSSFVKVHCITKWYNCLCDGCT